MTQRLDLVTNDAGDMVRREHARDLGAGVVVAMYRLAKVAQMHDLQNQAFVRQLEEAHKLIQEYCLRAGTNVNVLFARRAVFVAGQLLKGSRGVYESAAELAEILEWCGGAELTIARDVTTADLKAFAEAISAAMRAEKGRGYTEPSPRIRLREVNDAAKLRGLEIEPMTFEQRIVRTYASAVVVMRRFFEDLREGRSALPRRVKRIAQSLVDLSEGSTPAFLGVTEARNANHDEAGRAVNAAILAVAIAREVTDDRTALAHIAMAAMVRDVGRPRAAALARGDGPGMTGVVAKLSEDAEDKLAAGTAAVLTTLGRVNEATIVRTVVAYEALWIRRAAFIGPIYRGLRAATLQAKIVALSHRYNDLLTPEPGLAAPIADFAIATLWDELKEPSDRTVLRMLVSALGLYPMGTVVQLSTGEVAEVTGGGDARSSLSAPRVRLVMDAQGGVIDRTIEIDLARPRKGDPARAIVKVLSVDGWRKGLDASAARVSDVHAVDEGQRISSPPSSDASRDSVSGPSFPSFGTSPSQVAEAFGRRMIESPLAPPSSRVDAPVSSRPGGPSSSRPTKAPPRPPAPDRTVVQPSPFDDAEPDERPSLIGAVAVTTVVDPIEGATAAASGALATTPLVHTLVYVLDHALSGTVVFHEPDGAESRVYFASGAPAQAKLARPMAMLGDELIAAGAITREAVARAIESAKRLGVLLGEYLVGNDLIARNALTFALASQLRKKLAALVNLPPETTYHFYRDVNGLASWAGGETSLCHPLDAILACARGWHDRARVHATLGRVGREPLVLHADVDLSVLTMSDEEESTLAVLRAEGPTLAGLYKSQVADEEVISSLVYTLAVTRQFAFAKGAPMGREHAALATGDRISSIPFPAIIEPTSSRERPRAFAPQASSGNPSTWRPPQGRSGLLDDAPSSDVEIDVAVDLDDDPPLAMITTPPVARTTTPSPAPSFRESAVPSPPSGRVSAVPGVANRVSAIPGSMAARSSTAPGSLGPPRTTSTQALEAMTDFRLAETALQRSDLATAERFAQRALDNDPTHVDHGALLIWIRAAKATSNNDTIDAIDGLTKLLREAPTNERALLYRGKLYKRARKLREALRDFDAIVAANPKHSEAASEARLLRSKRK